MFRFSTSEPSNFLALLYLNVYFPLFYSLINIYGPRFVQILIVERQIDKTRLWDFINESSYNYNSVAREPRTTDKNQSPVQPLDIPFSVSVSFRYNITFNYTWRFISFCINICGPRWEWCGEWEWVSNRFTSANVLDHDFNRKECENIS